MSAVTTTYLSSDAGLTWKQADMLPEVPTAMDMIDSRGGTIIATTNGLWRDPRDGSGLERIGGDCPFTDLRREGNVILAEGSCAKYSLDDGETWKSLGWPHSFVEIAPLSWLGYQLYATYLSPDSGATWYDMKSPLDEQLYLDMIKDPASNVVYIGTATSGIFRLNDPASAMSRPEKLTQLTTYPNPTTDRVTISIGESSGKATIEVIDLRGSSQLLLHEPLTNGEISIDVTSLAAGSYFAIVKSGEELIGVTSFVKK